MAEEQVGSTQFEVLAFLAKQEDGMTVRALVDLLQASKDQVDAACRRLAKRRLVENVSSKPPFVYRITANGRRLVDRGRA